MAQLIKNKVGIIACSGEELAGGTITRAAARMVVEKLRPGKTIILCQPLFMAGGLERHGGQQEREFAHDHPTITLEGCNEECAKCAVERYSGPVAAVFRVEDVLKENPGLKPVRRENLDDDGVKVARILALKIAEKIDELMDNNQGRNGSCYEPESPSSGDCGCGRK
ncbi:MAG: putative zinc-binding protein [Promethearchaeota archaeon]